LKFKKFLNYLWEAPQKLISLIVTKIFSATPCGEYNGVKLYQWKRSDGLSLSGRIFLPFEYNEKQQKRTYYNNYVKHEYGHCVQSRKLGWLYLLIIGLPSIIWAGCFRNYREKHNVSYYSFFTEKWADKLGGVEREEE
jgi:hypothetical protein